MVSADNSKLRSRRLKEEERALWDEITRSVRPLRAGPTAPAKVAATAATPLPSSPPRRPGQVRQRGEEAPAPQVERIERRQRQRLGRGIDLIDARIDLHGKHQREAYAVLLTFLRRAQHQGLRFVLIITGKGAGPREHGEERGVLRRQVPLWLKLPDFRACVGAFETAHAAHGGEGALYVRLRRRRQ
jgi:DNA-nicking Smr family endonuclease